MVHAVVRVKAGPYITASGLGIRDEWRELTVPLRGQDQGQRDTAVRRHIGVLRKERIGVGFARHHIDVFLTARLPHPESGARRWRDRQTIPKGHIPALAAFC